MLIRCGYKLSDSEFFWLAGHQFGPTCLDQEFLRHLVATAHDDIETHGGASHRGIQNSGRTEPVGGIRIDINEDDSRCLSPLEAINGLEGIRWNDVGHKDSSTFLRQARPGLAMIVDHFTQPFWFENLDIITPGIKVPAHLQGAAGDETDDQ